MGERDNALLVDIGNSRIKWCWLRNGRIEPGRPFATHAAQFAPAFLESRLLNDAAPTQVLVSNVAGAGIASELEAWTQRYWGLSPRFVRPLARGHGVINGYSSPEKLGVDRWVCLVAARRAASGPICVADSGTAITFDVLDASGRHLGGLIAPGLSLMRRSLGEGTSDLPVVSSPLRDDLARDTLVAIASGTRQAAAGLIEHAFRTAVRRLGSEPRLLLTGGDAPELADELGIALELRPDLVFEGLAVIADEAP